MMKLSSSIFVLAAAVGCGGGKTNGPNVLPDSAPQPDSPDQVSCRLADTGTATALMQAGGFDTSNDPNTAEFVVQTDINSDATPDVATVLLFDGFGAFAAMGPIPSGAQTIQITGEEAQFASCGACILAGTDADAQGNLMDDYLVTSGTLNITSVSNQRIEGTITNATFTHVDIDMMTAMSTPNASGCTANIGTIAFNVVPMDITPMMKPTTPAQRLEALRALKRARAAH